MGDLSTRRLAWLEQNARKLVTEFLIDADVEGVAEERVEESGGHGALELVESGDLHEEIYEEIEAGTYCNQELLERVTFAIQRDTQSLMRERVGAPNEQHLFEFDSMNQESALAEAEDAAGRNPYLAATCTISMSIASALIVAVVVYRSANVAMAYLA